MSKLSIAGVIALVVLATPAQATEARWASPDDPAVKPIMEAARIWSKAGCSAQPELVSFFAEDFQGTTRGKRYGRDEVNPPGTDRDCRLGEVRIRLFSDDTAVAYGNETSQRVGADGKEATHCLVWTDVWMKRDDRWQIIAAHDTSAPCE